MREIAALPLAEDIPIAFNSTRMGPRGISWRSDKPAELCWMEVSTLCGKSHAGLYGKRCSLHARCCTYTQVVEVVLSKRLYMISSPALTGAKCNLQ